MSNKQLSFIKTSRIKTSFIKKRTIAVLMLTAAIVAAQMSGCVSTSGTANNSMDKQSYQGKIRHSESDVIRRIGYPTYQGVRQKGVVLLADQHSYLISTGDELLEQLTHFDSRYLQIEHPIHIQAYSDNTVRIRLSFSYQDTSQNKTPSLDQTQQKLLSQLCTNTKTQGYVICHLDLQGGMYQAVSQYSGTSISTDSRYQLKQGLPARIDYLKAKRAKNQAEIGVIPVSVAVDTLMIPLQILLIGKAFESL